MEGGRPRAFGPYLLHGELGRGGAGSVHLATLRRPIAGFPEIVVVKLLHAELGEDAPQVQRFRHEAELAVQIDSPYVAHVLDTGSVGSQLYITFEHIAGLSMRALIDELVALRRHLPVGDVLVLLRDTLRGLDVVHTARDRTTGDELKIIHRDVAPKNLMIRPSGQVCLIDLGIGRSVRSTWKTRTGMLLGTPGYMAPEQVLGLDVGERADLFAAGVVLFEMLTLRRCLSGTLPIDLVLASADPPRTPPSKHRSDVPPEVDRLVLRALSKEAADRHASAAEMLRELEALIVRFPPSGELLAEVLAEKTSAAASPLARETITETGGEGPEEPTEVFARTRTGARPPPRPRFPRIAIAAALAAAMMLGLLADRALRRDPVHVLPAPAPRAEEAPTPPAATAVSAQEPPEPEPVAVEEVERPAPRPPRRPDRPQPPVAAPAPDRASVARVVADLTARASALRTDHPDRARELDELLTDLALEAQSADAARASERVEALRRRLDAIARAPGGEQ